jgi:hypothetical protein
MVQPANANNYSTSCIFFLFGNVRFSFDTHSDVNLEHAEFNCVHVLGTGILLDNITLILNGYWCD